MVRKTKVRYKCTSLTLRDTCNHTLTLAGKLASFVHQACNSEVWSKLGPHLQSSIVYHTISCRKRVRSRAQITFDFVSMECNWPLCCGVHVYIYYTDAWWPMHVDKGKCQTEANSRIPDTGRNTSCNTDPRPVTSVSNPFPSFILSIYITVLTQALGLGRADSPLKEFLSSNVKNKRFFTYQIFGIFSFQHYVPRLHEQP